MLGNRLAVESVLASELINTEPCAVVRHQLLSDGGCDLPHAPCPRWGVADRTTQNLGNLAPVQSLPERQQWS